ncbi:MAG TPA: Rieske (2Fe-2S) protein [Candidatus Omnitrophota bacterium]|nr:Rieske (2Fe-2S) protein [Candidatus Omnitrophota bacterium]
MNEPVVKNECLDIALQKNLTRRGFIELIIKGGLFATLAGFILPAMAYLWPVTQKGPASSKNEICPLEEIPVWGAKKVILGGSAVVIIRTPQGVNAISAICTHLGCLVDWDNSKRQVACPCHAGFFDYTGKVVSGPPPRPLPSYKVDIINDKIYVTI